VSEIFNAYDLALWWDDGIPGTYSPLLLLWVTHLTATVPSGAGVRL
jgi:hypothetical protein